MASLQQQFEVNNDFKLKQNIYCLFFKTVVTEPGFYKTNKTWIYFY